jgi:hypothetical protein
MRILQHLAGGGQPAGDAGVTLRKLLRMRAQEAEFAFEVQQQIAHRRSALLGAAASIAFGDGVAMAAGLQNGIEDHGLGVGLQLQACAD